MSTGPRGKAQRRAGACPLLRALWLLAVLTGALAAGATSAAALKAIEINPDLDRIDITPLGEAYEGRGDNLRIETAPGADGTAGPMSVRAVTPGTSPSWFVFALVNSTDKTIERWLVADRYSAVGSGVVWPSLDARRIDAITPSLGYVPERINNDRADVFRLSVEPGQTVTFVAELASDRFTRLYLWKAVEYEQRARDRQLFNGILLGITGLLAIFLTVVFAANHKAIFPTAAIFTWCVLSYLCVDFGFWHKLFNMRPEDTAQYRAAAEAAMAGTLLVFLYTFLRLSTWHGFVRSLLALWMAAQLALVAVAFLDPRLAATFARLSSIAVAGIGAALILFLTLRGQDRAFALVPSWMLLLVWLFGEGAMFTGRLSGDIVVFGLSAGLVLIVVLFGFTVTQYAFRSSFEPLYGAQPDDEKLRSLAVDGAGAAVWEWNARRDEVKVSPVVEAVLGLKVGQLSTRTEKFLRHMHPADRERFKLLVWSVKENAGGEMRMELRLRHADGSYRWFELEAASVPTPDRRHLRYVGLMREVTDAKRAQERLMYDAVNDTLTGLPNRELFLDRLAIAAKRATLEPLVRPALLFIDIDKFRNVNATHGLVVGDSLLLTLARRLARHMGPQDTLARIGGDQFALLLLNQSEPRELAMLAEQVRRSLRAPMEIAGKDIVLTASIGIALYDGPDEDPAELLREAKIAMYRAKRTGTDRIEIFTAEMRQDKDGRVAVEADLRRAIEKRQIRLVYQPIFYLATEVLAGFEAQMRWDHPSQGTLDPTRFIPIAEDSDLIMVLGSFALNQAINETVRWQKELPRPDLPLFVSVDVPSRQLLRPELAHEMRRLLARAVLPRGSVRLEIPEAVVMENPERATGVLALFTEAGARLALDDFATGYSSLSYLNQLAFDSVKVERSFIQSSGQNGSGSPILRSVVALSHELGKKVVVDGVETEEDVAFLRSIGCEYAQGPYYGDPMPDREAMQLVRVARKVERRMKRSALFSRRRASGEPEAHEPVTERPAARASEYIAVNGAAEAPVQAKLPAPPPNGTARPTPAAGGASPPPKLAPVSERTERKPGPPPLPAKRPAAAPPASGPAPSRPPERQGAPPQPRTSAPPPPKRGEPPRLPVSRQQGAAPHPAPRPPPGAVPRPGPPPVSSKPPPAAGSASPGPRNGSVRATPPPPPPGPRTTPVSPPPPRPAPNGRPQADFSSLPPAIAESLARLAGRPAVAPGPGREVAESTADSPQGPDKPTQQ